jgi:hypothetical protein
MKKGTLLGENGTFSAVSLVPLEGFSKTQDLASAPTSYRSCRLSHDRSILKGTLPGEGNTFSLLSHLPFEWFLWNSTSHNMSSYTKKICLVAIGQKWRELYYETPCLALWAHALQNLCVWSRTVNHEGALYLDNKVFSRLYLVFSWKEYPENSCLTLCENALQK